MLRNAVVVAFAVICAPGQHAMAIWMRSESLEWWTNISDTVAIARVGAVKDIEPLNEYWKSQEVLCLPVTALKGERIGQVTFRQDYAAKLRETDDAIVRPQNDLLLFCVRTDDRQETEIVFWVNLTKPDAKLSGHAAYNNDCRWLDDRTSILHLIKERIAKENPVERKKQRGLIVEFTADEPRDMYWDFVRTADPAYKTVLVKQLRDGDANDKESAIYNLISYPGKDTLDLIRPFLRDTTRSELQRSDGSKTVVIYPVRQAAYSALRLLGESVEKPGGYYSDPSLWLFKVGFESEVYFPYGDWKRHED